MAFDLGSIIARVTADTTQFMASMDGVKAAADTAGSKLASMGNGINSAASAIMPFSIAAGAALAISTKAAIDFNQAMELVHTQAGASQQEVDALKNSVLALAPAVGEGPTDLANALYHIESVGYRGQQAMDILKLAAEGAQVGQANLDDTTYALTSTLSSMIDGAQNATEAMGYLNAIVGAGDMHMQDLNGAIGTGFLASAQVFGLSLQSTGAALATLTDNGEDATEAATRLRMSMSLMAAPSGEAAKAMAGIGLSSTQLGQDLRKPDGFLVALNDLKAHLQDTFGPEAVGEMQTYQQILNKDGVAAADKYAASAGGAAEALSKMFGGGRSDAAILTLMTNTDRLSTKFNDIGANAGKFQSDWAAQQDQAAQKMKDFQAQLQVLEVQLGNTFLPILTSLAKAIGDFAEGFGRLSPSTQKAIVDILLFVAALGPILKVVADVVKLFGVLADVVDFLMPVFEALGTAVVAVAAVLGLPVEIVVAIIAALVALGVGIYEAITHWSDVTAFIGKMWDGIANEFSKGIDKVKSIFTDAMTLLDNIWDLFTGGDPTTTPTDAKLPWTNFMISMDNARQDIIDFVTAIPDELKKFWDTIAGDARAGWDAFVGAITWKNVLKIFYDLGFAVGTLVRIYIDFYTKTIPQFVEGVAGWFEKLPGLISNAMIAAYNVASTWTYKMWQDIEGGTVAGFNATVNWFAQLPTRISNAMIAAYNAASTWTYNLWHTVEIATVQGWNDVVGWFDALPGRVWGAMVALWNNAVAAGNNVKNGIMGGINAIPGLLQNVLNNLLNMITNSISALGKKAADVGNAIWSGFKNAMGIKSPSYIEKAFTAIEAQGHSSLDAMKNHVAGMNQLANQVNAMTPGIALAGLTAAGATQITTHFNGPITISKDADAMQALSILSRNQELAGRGLTTLKGTQ